MFRVRTMLLLVLFCLCCRTSHTPPLSDRITLAVPYEPDTLDPYSRNKVSDLAMMFHFYESLVTTDAQMHIKPCLAASWENPDLQTWLFHLRPDVQFHSGKSLTSADVVYSFDRLLKDGSLEISGYVNSIESIRAKGPWEVEIRTFRPFSVLLNKIRFISIMPQGSDPKAFRTREDGTGPYKLISWNKGRIVLKRSETYWGPAPDMRDVTYSLGCTADRAIRMLAAGQCEFVQANTRAVEKANLDPKRFQIIHGDSVYLKYLGYSLEREYPELCSLDRNPFKDLRVRQALHLALNRDDLVRKLSTFAIPAYEPVPVFVFGYNPQLPRVKQDLRAARELMKQAGLEQGFRVTLHVRDIFREAALLVRQQLAELGIQIELKALPDPEFFDILKSHQSILWLSRWGCPTGDASDVLDNCVHSTDQRRHYGAQNYSEYRNEAVDRAIEESAEIRDTEGRRLALQTIMKMFMDDLVWLPLYVDQDVYGLNRSLDWSPRNDSLILASEIKIRH